MLMELLILIAIILLLYQRWTKRDVYTLGKQLNSGVWTLPFFGHSYLFLGDNHRRMTSFKILGRDAIKKENGLTSLWHGNYLYTMIAEPKAAELVLKTCLEKDDVVKMVVPFIGNGSLFAPVSIWRPRRKILNPSFSMRNLKSFMAIFVEQSDILVEVMRKEAGTGTFPVWKYAAAYTMDAIAETSLGYKLNAQKDPSHPFLISFDYALKTTAERICQPWLHSDFVYNRLPVYQKLIEYKKTVWGCVMEFIKDKRKEIKDIYAREAYEKSTSEGRLKTFLELFISLSGGDEGYTDTEVLEESIMIMMAGNDTSAVGISFISVMLSRYPEVQEKLYKELQDMFGDSDRPVTFEDLPRLKYLDAVVKETLRLYPPVPIIVRKVEKDVLLPTGVKIVPGTGVIMNIWALHRNPRYWGDDAEEFRPERFLHTLKEPAAFMPFSHGPRNCVGYQYGMMSMKTAVATLLRHFKILPASAPNSDSEHPPLRLKFDMMMKDVNEFQIQIQHRC